MRAVVAETVGDRQVDHAVAVEVGGGQAGGPAAGHHGGGGMGGGQPGGEGLEGKLLGRQGGGAGEQEAEEVRPRIEHLCLLFFLKRVPRRPKRKARARRAGRKKARKMGPFRVGGRAAATVATVQRRPSRRSAPAQARAARRAKQAAAQAFEPQRQKAAAMAAPEEPGREETLAGRGRRGERRGERRRTAGWRCAATRPIRSANGKTSSRRSVSPATRHSLAEAASRRWQSSSAPTRASTTWPGRSGSPAAARVTVSPSAKSGAMQSPRTGKLRPASSPARRRRPGAPRRRIGDRWLTRPSSHRHARSGPAAADLPRWTRCHGKEAT